MNKKQLEEQREKLRSQLQIIVTAADIVEKEMATLEHPRGRVYRSLKHKSGDYIVHSKRGFMAHYTDANGTKYEIQIYRDDKNLQLPL